MSREQQRRIAQEAARLMVSDHISSIPQARQKAMRRLGIQDKKLAPDNQLVEDALIEYQRLFGGEEQENTLREMRQTAQQAMKLTADFEPRLVGPVLKGTASEFDAVSLHVFTDTPEEVYFLLQEHNIPFTIEDHQYQQTRDQSMSCPAYRFVAGEHEVVITVFPWQSLRQAPLSPIDDKPMKRASIKQVETLLRDAL